MRELAQLLVGALRLVERLADERRSVTGVAFERPLRPEPVRRKARCEHHVMQPSRD